MTVSPPLTGGLFSYVIYPLIMTAVCNDQTPFKMAKHIMLPAFLVGAGVLPAAALIVPFGMGLHAIYKHNSDIENNAR